MGVGVWCEIAVYYFYAPLLPQVSRRLLVTVKVSLAPMIKILEYSYLTSVSYLIYNHCPCDSRKIHL